MNWLRSHRKFTIVAAVLIVLILLFTASYALKDSNNAVGAAAGTVVTTIQKPFGAVGNVFANIRAGFSNTDTASENEDLRREIIKLRNELRKERLDREEIEELKTLSAILNVPDVASYKPIAANVIAFEGSNGFNIITIDVGADEGVVRNTVAVSGDCVIGRVVECGQGWSKIIAAIDESNNMGFQIRGEGRDYLGVIHGNGKGSLTGYLLDEDAQAKKGDIVYTSGIGGVYPPGLLIGEVTKAKTTKDSPLLSVTVKPAAYIEGLKKVVVLV